MTRNEQGAPIVPLPACVKRHKMLTQTAKTIDALVQSRVPLAGATLLHVDALLYLETAGAMACSRLAEALGLSGGLTRLVDVLEARGWAARRRNAQDRRVIEVSLTADGYALAGHARPIVEQAWREVAEQAGAGGMII